MVPWMKHGACDLSIRISAFSIHHNVILIVHNAIPDNDALNVAYGGSPSAIARQLAVMAERYRQATAMSVHDGTCTDHADADAITPATVQP